jgi:hypothetical protein
LVSTTLLAFAIAGSFSRFASAMHEPRCSHATDCTVLTFGGSFTGRHDFPPSWLTEMPAPAA